MRDVRRMGTRPTPNVVKKLVSVLSSSLNSPVGVYSCHGELNIHSAPTSAVPARARPNPIIR